MRRDPPRGYAPGVFRFLRRRKLEALKARPLPEAWRAVALRNVPYLRDLPPEDLRELEGLMQIFLAEKRFEGCGGMEITDEVRVTVAAQACLLLLHRDTDVYPDLVSIVIYPSAFRVPSRQPAGGVVIEGTSTLAGESWARDVVVLSWDHVVADARNPADGKNVVLHEFAHQLDAEEGAMDGAPDLGSGKRYGPWARVLGAEYEELARELREGLRGDIDTYGAKNPPEFFAVVTEEFFEKPLALRERHPELYAQLRDFYRQDPAERRASNQERDPR